MHAFDEAPSSSTDSGSFSGPWYKELNSYHWFVLIVAALGWLFDTMDQQLFVLARPDAMKEFAVKALVSESPGTTAAELDPKVVRARVADYSGIATAIFLIGWATGGLGFGVLGDRIGRVKTMLITILAYSLCTGLSAFSTGIWDFSFYRFLTGLGVGGEFAVGVALVAEVMPNRARPFALGLLQALSAIGNISAALFSMGLGHLEAEGAFKDLVLFETPIKAWRLMFVIGILPALLAIVIRRRLKEPERWKSAAGTAPKLGSYSELFGHPTWRKNAIVGLCLAFSGVVGLWAVGFFVPDLMTSVLTKKFESEGLTPDAVSGKVAFWRGIVGIMTNLGAFFGIYAFSYITYYTGRKPAFAVAFIAAMFSTASVFMYLKDFSQIFWMVPLMGFCQLALFGGYAIYFPELFPTHLRSTGTSFCYNVGRFVAATGPLLLGKLTSTVFHNAPEPLRYAGVTMCAVFLLGLLALPFAPETKGKPLPE